MAQKGSVSGYALLKLRCIRFISQLFGRFKEDRIVPTSSMTAAWHCVDAGVRPSQSIHDRHWWTHSGYVLAVLLKQAGYSTDEQYKSLDFFAVLIAPSLGATPSGTDDRSRWSSFMTDDKRPIELSWDWGVSDQRPTIRYSIEPVGLDAGTPRDKVASLLMCLFKRY